jgi:hypothetical protein
MNSAIQKIIKDHNDLLLSQIAEKFSVNPDELNELAESVFNTKLGRTNAPRKKREVVSAYLAFCAKTRDSIKKESPEMKFGDVSKRLGEMWGKLTPEEKATYAAVTAPTTTTTTEDEIENEIEDVITENIEEIVNEELPPPIQEALRQQLEASKISELRKMCKNYGLDTSTQRQEMIQNILAHRATTTATA